MTAATETPWIVLVEHPDGRKYTMGDSAVRLGSSGWTREQAEGVAAWLMTQPWAGNPVLSATALAYVPPKPDAGPLTLSALVVLLQAKLAAHGDQPVLVTFDNGACWEELNARDVYLGKGGSSYGPIESETFLTIDVNGDMRDEVGHPDDPEGT